MNTILTDDERRALMARYGSGATPDENNDYMTGDYPLVCAAEAAVLAKLREQEPVAMRYDFDGYGYRYIDSGSGSDWRTRIPDAEAVYAAPQPAVVQVPQVDWAADAQEWGGALNDAGWEFDEAYRRHMGEPVSAKLFNTCKTIIRDVILRYAEKVSAAAPKAPAPAVVQVPQGWVLAPDWKGYALLGTGNYVIEHSADFDPELGAELIIRLATDDDREGGRQIGEARPTKTPGAPIYPEDMVIRIGFLSERALFALEDQLRAIRETHFAAAPEAPAQARYFEQYPGQPIEEIDEQRFNRTPEDCRFKLYATPEAPALPAEVREAIKVAREALRLVSYSDNRVDAALARIDALGGAA